MSGSQHFLQAVPLVAALVLSWRHPRWAGFVLIGVGALLFLAWLILVGTSERSDSGSAMWVVAALLLFVPPIVSGFLLLKASGGVRG